MTAYEITASFGPVPADRAALSRSSLTTLETIYRHPVAHSLEWTDVVALVSRIGSVEHKSNDETCFEISGERRLFRKPHAKEIPSASLIELRHMLTRAGWAPDAKHPARTDDGAGSSPIAPDLLVTVEQREARLYHLDFVAGDEDYRRIHTELSPHELSLHAKGDVRPGNSGWASDPGYYERIAQALHDAGSIVLAGHGKGHSNAAHHLRDYLQQHQPEIFHRLRSTIEADLPGLSGAQLRVLGRQSLADAETASAAG